MKIFIIVILPILVSCTSELVRHMDITHRSRSTRLYDSHTVQVKEKIVYDMYETTISNSYYPEILKKTLSEIYIKQDLGACQPICPYEILDLIINYCIDKKDTLILLLLVDQNFYEETTGNPLCFSERIRNNFNSVNFNIENPENSSFWIGTIPIRMLKKFEFPRPKLEMSTRHYGYIRSNYYMKLFYKYISLSSQVIERNLEGSSNTMYFSEVPFKNQNGSLLFYGYQKHNYDIAYPVSAITNDKSLIKDLESLVECIPKNPDVEVRLKLLSSIVIIIEIHQKKRISKIVFLYNYGCNHYDLNDPDKKIIINTEFKKTSKNTQIIPTDTLTTTDNNNFCCCCKIL